VEPARYRVTYGDSLAINRVVCLPLPRQYDRCAKARPAVLRCYLVAVLSLQQCGIHINGAGGAAQQTMAQYDNIQTAISAVGACGGRCMSVPLFYVGTAGAIISGEQAYLAPQQNRKKLVNDGNAAARLAAHHFAVCEDVSKTLNDENNVPNVAAA